MIFRLIGKPPNVCIVQSAANIVCGIWGIEARKIVMPTIIYFGFKFN